MKTHKISGVIGCDAMASDLNKFLNDANGEDVELIISSPGGLVGEALEMFNAVRAYPGKTIAILSGYAMSAASYIPMAANEVKAEDNAVMMIHNAQGLEWGDHNQLMKTANIMKGLSAMLGQAYSKFTGKTKDEVAALMDAETWFFGDEIVSNGFAHASIIRENETNEDPESATAQARLAFSSMVAKLSSEKTAFMNDLSRAATALGATGAMPNKTEKEMKMDLKTLKEKHPDLCAAIASEATADMDAKITAAKVEGAEGERVRIQDVRAQLVPGHEALIEALAFDGKTSGPEAAVKVIAAEKEQRAAILRNFQETAPNAVDQPSTGNAPADKVKADWDKDAKLRAEFANDYEAYAAYMKDDPGFNVKSGKRA